MRRRDRRPPPISYRPTVAERDAVLARIRASGRSTSSFITAAILGRDPARARPTPRLEHQDAARLMGAIQQLAATLREQAREANAPVIDACLQECMALRALLLALLGRAP